jgi:hypothetical protein
MPMHDWTKVKPGIYPDFHNLWLHAIRHALNNGVLPTGYYALTEQRVAAIEADVLALQSAETGAPAAAAKEAEPAVALLERAKAAPRPLGRRLVVRDAGHEVVAVIELVSPGNVKEREEFDAFVGKAADLLWAGVHLLVVNPFRSPNHARGGLHAAIWKKVTRPRKGKRLFAPTVDGPLVAASYCASSAEITAAVQTFAVGDPVPDIPLYLTGDEEYVTIPLEATYQAAWPEVPKVWRNVLEG